MIAERFRCGSLQIQILRAKCANRFYRKKPPLYKGDHNREYPADIAKLATIEFAAHRIILSARPPTARDARKKLSGNRVSMPLQIFYRGVLFPVRRVITVCS